MLQRMNEQRENRRAESRWTSTDWAIAALATVGVEALSATRVL